MYSPASIKPLSKAQLSKLLKGNPVRVTSGSGMKLHLSKPQHKKLTAAHKRGGGMNLQFDPYQCQMHAKGGGFLDDLEAFSVKALPALTNAGYQLLDLAPKTELNKYLIDEYTKPKTEADAAELQRFLGKGGNIMEDFGDAAGKFISGTLRDLNLGQEKDPLGFLYGKGKKSKKSKKGGRLLIDEPITARQVVNTAKDFVSDPLGTLGFGLKRKVSKKKGGALLDFVPKELQDMGMKQLKQYENMIPKEARDLGMSKLKQIGMGKARKPMSEAQKAALAKGRAALAAKRGGAAVHPKHAKGGRKKMSGSALYPAGYSHKGSALMPAGY
jgi:hypothetical protein